MPDWNPECYDQFSGPRLRPALDLLRAIPKPPSGPIVDLGCGSGAVGPALRQRFPERELIGVDSSPAMLDKAVATTSYDSLLEADVAAWVPSSAPALIFSNATLHWLPNHPSLMPHLVKMLAPEGLLAVQMPAQNAAPSHRSWLELAERIDAAAVEKLELPGILEPRDYVDLLGPWGGVELWTTTYYQRLAASDQGHPVRLFTQSTFARPVLQAVGDERIDALIGSYDAFIDEHYPRRGDGSVLFPFKRLFFVLARSRQSAA